ncbi:Uma2 family endonuclease [Sorangium sp. So ce281]|uniref:Uma2 family endonuclease n=1 Tax=Sorangium sp. So ce281 TaxID=3133293 RepID=UPI003F602CD6
MVQALPTGYLFDPADPRAPTSEQWARMTPAERARVVDMLPAEVPLELMPPEGDPHRKAKRDALDALDGFFRRTARKIYLSSELAVFYPGEPRFAPDLLAVIDVEPHERMRWVVDHEGKGLDLVIEVHVAGSRTKDHQLNVDRYARLGIREYFLFDRARLRLHAYRLPAAQESDPSRPRAYQRIVPQAGRFASEVLGLDLLLDGTRLRFFAGNALLEDADERIARLGVMLDQVISHQEEAQRVAEELAAELDRERRLREEEQRLREEEQRLREEEQRLREEEQRLREETEKQLAQARAEIERLKSR